MLSLNQTRKSNPTAYIHLSLNIHKPLEHNRGTTHKKTRVWAKAQGPWWIWLEEGDVTRSLWPWYICRVRWGGKEWSLRPRQRQRNLTQRTKTDKMWQHHPLVRKQILSKLQASQRLIGLILNEGLIIKFTITKLSHSKCLFDATAHYHTPCKIFALFVMCWGICGLSAPFAALLFLKTCNISCSTYCTDYYYYYWCCCYNVVLPIAYTFSASQYSCECCSL